MKRIGRLLKTNLFRTVGQLYIVQMASYALPLVTVPYLARRLGTTGVGIVATFQVLGNYFATINDFGFALSAMRDAAMCRHDKRELSRLLGCVVGARILLGLGCGVVMFALGYLLPSLRNQNLMLAAALLYTFGQSNSPIWLYQATGRIAFVTTWDLIARTLGVAATFVFVKGPQDAWLALAIPGASILASAVFELLVAYRDIPFFVPSFGMVLSTIRRGYAIFLSRCISSLLNSGNALILSLFAAPAAVGYYSGAERIFRAGLQGMYPISQVMFPRVASLLARDPVRARTEVLKSLALTVGAAVCLSATMVIFSRVLVRVILGPAFGPSIGLLMIFALAPVFRAVSDVLGLQWMISHGLDREYTICLTIAGIVSAALAFFLSQHWTQAGAAWAVVGSEALMAIGVVVFSGWRHILPFPGLGSRLEIAVAVAGESD